MFIRTCLINTYFLDVETCGLHGVPVLLQYAVNDGPVQVVHLWATPIRRSIEIIRQIIDSRVVAHNLRFDFFHVSKWHNMMIQIPEDEWDLTPQQARSYDYWAHREFDAQHGPCLKPRAAICTLLLVSKGAGQAVVMDAKPVYIRRIPAIVAQELCDELNQRTELPWILFAGREGSMWKVCDIKNEEGEKDPNWKELKLSFSPSKGLKDLAKYLLGYEPAARFEDIQPPEMPVEEGFAPFATLLSSGPGWEYQGKKTWPALIDQHINHWANSLDALAYAVDDIEMLRRLYDYCGSPQEDEDGLLACQVASVRLRGFPVDLDAMRRERARSMEIIESARLNVNSPKQVRGFLSEALDPMEQIIIAKSCDKKVLANLKLEFTLEAEEECFCDGGCQRCEGCGKVGPGPMPVVKRAEHIEEVRRHKKRVEVYDKLLLAKRAYPDLNVVGAKSGRMSGASGLNFQGIGKSEDVRSLFPFADEGWVLSGGDHQSQELAIAAAVMNDEKLMTDLESGKSLHGLFGAELFQTTYEDIMATKGERYDKAKSAIYCTLYGGTFETMAKNAGVEVEVAQRAYDDMCKKYPKMGDARKTITERFSALTQPGGKGSPIVYRDPPEKFIESIFGFRRYFDTEYEIQRMILDLAQNLPDRWKGTQAKIQRSDRLQTLEGALMSALYGAAFSIQNKVIRASNNHVIQSSGRTITIGDQAAIWETQPQGVHPFRLALMSIHDEIVVVSRPEYVEEITERVKAKVAEQCEKVPLLALEWGRYLKNWHHLKKAKVGEDDMVPCGFGS